MADNPTFTTTVATLPSGTVGGLMQEATTGAYVARGVSVFQTGGSTGAWTFTLATSGAGAVTGGTQRITLASDDPAVAAIGAKADSSATTDTGTFSLIALFKRLLEKVTAQLPAALTGSGNLKTAIQEALPAGANAIGGVTQSGTWTVQPGNTANTTAWLVTGTGGTFPVTDSAGSLTVDAPVGTPVFVRLSDGASAITTLAVSLASVPSHDVTNAGTFAVQAAQSGSWTVTANAGTNLNTSALALESGGNLAAIAASAAILDNIVSGNEAQVDVVTLPEVPPAASATVTGCTPYFDSDGDNTAQTIKGSSGRLYFLEVSNPNTADAYLQLYDENGAITVGTTTPKLSFLVPAGDGTNDGAFDRVFVVPIEFANSIKYACTTTPTGSGDPTTGLIVNAGYR